MPPPSGFVPIPFHRVGRLLVALGTAGVIMVGLSSLIDWISTPKGSLILSLVIVLLGLYLLYAVPRDHES